MRAKDNVITIEDFFEDDECEVVRPQAANDGHASDGSADQGARGDGPSATDQEAGEPVAAPSPVRWLPRQRDLAALLALNPIVCPQTSSERNQTRWPLFMILERGEADVASIERQEVSGRFPHGIGHGCLNLGEVVDWYCGVPEDLRDYALLLVSAIEGNLRSNGVVVDGRTVFGRAEVPCLGHAHDTRREKGGESVWFVEDNALDAATAYRILAAACDEVASQLVIGCLCLRANTGETLPEHSVTSLAEAIVDRWYMESWCYPLLWTENTYHAGRCIEYPVYVLAQNALDRARIRQLAAAGCEEASETDTDMSHVVTEGCRLFE